MVDNKTDIILLITKLLQIHITHILIKEDIIIGTHNFLLII